MCESAGEHFGHRGFACSSGRHVADGNHLDSERIAPQKSDTVEEIPYGHDPCEYYAENFKKAQQKRHRERLVLVGALLENYLYEIFLKTLDSALPGFTHLYQSPNIDPALSPKALR